MITADVSNAIIVDTGYNAVVLEAMGTGGLDADSDIVNESVNGGALISRASR